MRTPRIVIVAAFFFAIITLTSISLQSSHTDPTYATQTTEPPGGLRTIFSFHTPLSLFPPNAIISLTDDNTTSFMARPAAFGPLLPAKGLSGQLWIGSGFGDERQGSIVTGAEGELGCSDVPGWSDGNKNTGSNGLGQRVSGGVKGSNAQSAAKTRRMTAGTGHDVDGNSFAGRIDTSDKEYMESMDDGTDDYLSNPATGSTNSKSKTYGQDLENHADIQSMQEGAEIAGKIVLLSRGGCGFLEKVKWAQRRGGIALIVGDDTRGGPLIQMYARGDTSNVTIPSIFTSHTTAHLLSSLIPPGSFIEDLIDENGKMTTKVQHSKKPKKGRKKSSKQGSSVQTPPKSTANPKPAAKASVGKPTGLKGAKAPSSEDKRGGWFSSLFSRSKSTTSAKPPQGNGKDWVLSNEWDELEDDRGRSSSKSRNSKSRVKESDGQAATDDDFVIGVDDWRDRDHLGTSTPNKVKEGNSAKNEQNKPSTKGSSGKKKSPGKTKANPALEGGSITPGSGEYEDSSPATKNTPKGPKSGSGSEKSTEKGKSGLVNTLFGDDNDESYVPISSINDVDDDAEILAETEEDVDEPGHEGLWVTLTPTSGASPFFDTLLVLVVSPLVTLTVVYALLLLRSRIRRRRWRAPKSVVERLPVRTYQTISSSTHSLLPSPTTSSPTTPLLQHRSRPRSRTTSVLPQPNLLLRTNSNNSMHSSRTPSRGQDHEKGVPNEWKKYMGKQVECVVCLEEYVDGVSRVMSLPCGHEFHVDCITPWLTTRRRTCPICKGDVVRSLARGSPSGPRYEAYRDDSDDDVQTPAGEMDMESPSDAVPIGRDGEDTNEDDLERGILPSSLPRPRLNNRMGSWRSILASSFGSTSRSPQPTQEDRSR